MGFLTAFYFGLSTETNGTVLDSSCPGCRQCETQNSICAGPGLQTRPCCGGLECKHLLGGSQSICIRREAACMDEGSICAGPGLLTHPCCSGLECKQLLGGAQSKCTKELPTCVDEGGICGGPGQMTQTCCGTLSCRTQRGGNGKMQCVQSLPMLRGSGSNSSIANESVQLVQNESEVLATNMVPESAMHNSSFISSVFSWQCANEHQHCGKAHWWSLNRRCCANLECQHLLGGAESKCVKIQPQCMGENGVCAGDGLQTHACCGGLKCQRLFGGSQSKCVKQESHCIADGDICAGPGIQTVGCCGDLECQRLLGGSQSKCIKKQSQNCVAKGNTCGGPGQLTQPCCHGAVCKPLLGGGKMECQ